MRDQMAIAAAPATPDLLRRVVLLPSVPLLGNSRQGRLCISGSPTGAPTLTSIWVQPNIRREKCPPYHDRPDHIALSHQGQAR
jgi:hypothetical protein